MLNESCYLKEGFVARVSKAFVSSDIRVWLAWGSCCDKVDAIGKLCECGLGEAVGIE